MVVMSSGTPLNIGAANQHILQQSAANAQIITQDKQQHMQIQYQQQLKTAQQAAMQQMQQQHQQQMQMHLQSSPQHTTQQQHQQAIQNQLIQNQQHQNQGIVTLQGQPVVLQGQNVQPLTLASGQSINIAQHTAAAQQIQQMQIQQNAMATGQVSIQPKPLGQQTVHVATSMSQQHNEQKLTLPVVSTANISNMISSMQAVSLNPIFVKAKLLKIYFFKN